MRIAIRALAIKRRSMAAIKRANRPLDEANWAETTLDIVVPFAESSDRPRCDPGLT